MLPMIESEMVSAFERILAEEFGLNPAECRESPEWWRFQVDDRALQGGVHRADFRVLCLICPTKTDADLDKLQEDLDQANMMSGSKLARFIESDCYLYTRSLCGFDNISADKMIEMIKECVRISRSEFAQKLRSRWRADY